MICFVVLHYQNLDVTHTCISYLRKLRGILNEHIIIVDNGSPNGTGLSLKREYEEDSVISVIISRENLGFAKGNNLGYDYAKNILGAELIVVMNSDVYIKDEDFIRKLYSAKNDNKNIAIAAPDIINRQGCHCNPMIIPPISRNSIVKIWRESFIRYILYSVPIINKKLWVRAQKKEFWEKENRVGWDHDISDIVPDGSCIIYFPNWVRKEEFAFVPITFMYAEEHILYEYLKHNEYESIYLHCLQVFHMEGATTGTLTKSNICEGIKNKKRNLIWHMDACKIYLNYKQRLCKK